MPITCYLIEIAKGFGIAIGMCVVSLLIEYIVCSIERHNHNKEKWRI